MLSDKLRGLAFLLTTGLLRTYPAEKSIEFRS